MATFEFKGLEEYEIKLSRLQSAKTTREIAAKAIYEGAGIVTDAIRGNIRTLRVSRDVHKCVTPQQKEGLLNGLGIAHMRSDNGYYNVKPGFDGYNAHKGKKYPKGQPNQLVARSLEKGTSTAPRQAFVAPAVRKSKKAAEAAMAKILDEEIQKIMK